jgi:hypothetical protein
MVPFGDSATEEDEDDALFNPFQLLLAIPLKAISFLFVIEQLRVWLDGVEERNGLTC